MACKCSGENAAADQPDGLELGLRRNPCRRDNCRDKTELTVTARRDILGPTMPALKCRALIKCSAEHDQAPIQ